MNIEEIKKLHHEFNECYDINYRLSALKKLKQIITKYEQAILTALRKDLNKNEKETYLCEINEVLSEIDYHCKNLKKWNKIKKVKSTYQVFGTKSFIHYQPKGKVLIIVPFNYPFNLSFMPLIGAISAGNKVLIKMSKLTPYTNMIIKTIIAETFVLNHVSMVDEKKINYEELFEYEPQFLFFTGSSVIGKKIEAKCVEKNIEYVTEMGGSNPCLVNDIINDQIYERIIWAKFLNAGQTCLSINYLLYNEQIVDFIEKLKICTNKQYPNPLINRNIPKIIDQKNFLRLKKIILENQENVIYGGNFDESSLIIEPTIILIEHSKIKTYGEIFGPILFISKMDTKFENNIYLINNIDPYPLAGYVFTKNQLISNLFIKHINAGGYCINDAIIHISNHFLPFGGIYTSGSGKYHGKFSFETFSFIKPILINNQFFENKIRYINNHLDLQRSKKIINLIKKIKK